MKQYRHTANCPSREKMSIYIGTAGWNVPAAAADRFPVAGTHLQRYSQVLNAVEINTTFYRAHRPQTFEKWASQTPDSFRFAVKLPRQITHGQRLVDCGKLLRDFLVQTSSLGAKCGPLLVQLPPSLQFSGEKATNFFRAMRTQTNLPVVCEPRHSSWFSQDVEEVFLNFQISRVAADPSVVPAATVPGGAMQTCYFRWHGSPRTYYSKYDHRALKDLAAGIDQIRREANDVWCIFDNTAVGSAVSNALELRELLAR
jgi:uncharacterized protein YecE (DUF72 family)